MSATLYLSRVVLRNDAPIQALARVLVPSGDDERVAASHRLVWTMFGDSPERRRDFLWREAAPGRFYVLSARPPVDEHRLFHLDPPKPFDPAFRSGDRLRFLLRANATVARGTEKGARGKPCDVVMDALARVPSGERAVVRDEKATGAGLAWLGRQAARSGFLIESNEEGKPMASVTGYRVMNLEPGRRGIRLGVLDFEGVLQVVDPAVFLASVGQGFGRAKAFGFGLMLLRRA